MVSVQIPTYNQKQFIKQALDSALAQDYEHLQIIVADDCSTDYDIFEYLKDYSNHPKVLIHRNEMNLGRVGNYRSTLYNLVKGEYFVNLDGDDYFTNPNFISYAIETIKQHKDVTSVFMANSGKDKVEHEKAQIHQINENTFSMKGLDYFKNLGMGLNFSHGSVLARTDFAKNANYYNVNNLDSDYYSFLKILKEGNVIFWNTKVYKVRDHSQRASYTKDYEQIKKKYDALEDLRIYYSDKLDSDISKTMKAIGKVLFGQLTSCWLKEGKKLNRISYIAKKFLIR